MDRAVIETLQFHEHTLSIYCVIPMKYLRGRKKNTCYTAVNKALQDFLNKPEGVFSAEVDILILNDSIELSQCAGRNEKWKINTEKSILGN